MTEKRKKFIIRIFIFIGITAVAYMQTTVMLAFAWATFAGFGAGSIYEYNETGQFVCGVVSYALEAVLILVLLWRMRMYHKRGESVKKIVPEALLCVAGIAFGAAISFRFPWMELFHLVQDHIWNMDWIRTVSP